MIEYLPLKRISAMYADEIHEAVSRVVDSGWYLRGETTARFEQAYAEYIGTRHCIGVANGLDALTLILRAYKELGALHEGDEVIVPANTYIASILSITENRLVPVLVEPSPATLQIDDTRIEQAITPRTRAIMIVHLYGRCAYTSLIADICRRHNLLLIEDNAQAHGCKPTLSLQRSAAGSCAEAPASVPSVGCAAALPQSRTGSLGHAAAHSFYPTKNLGALGDAGAVTTNDAQLAAAIRSIANYGSSSKYHFDYLGRNSRLDEVQAAVLLAKLPHLDADNQRRKDIAARYERAVSNPIVRLRLDDSEPALPSLHPSPFTLHEALNTIHHIFPIFCSRRDELQRYLAENGVETLIHYPIPPHKQRCYREWNHLSLPVTELIHAQELSIPCHQAMTDIEVDAVIGLLNNFV